MTVLPPSARRPLFALVGPTASGKTEASIPLAEALEAEIVCVDSMLVYRGMDVGTAKPSDEQRARVRHHLLDILDPTAPFSVAAFQSAARKAIADIVTRGRRPLLVGGSGLYYRAVVDGLQFPRTDASVRGLLEAEASAVGPLALHERLAGLDPRAARRIEPSNLRRTVRALEVAALTGRPFSAFARNWERYSPRSLRVVGVDVPRAALHGRIAERAQRMMPGLVEETQRLIDLGFASFLTSSQAIGYAEALAFLGGGLRLEEAEQRIARRTRALARRQMAWFRRDPRVRWVTVGPDGAAEAVDQILRALKDETRTSPPLAEMGRRR